MNAQITKADRDRLAAWAKEIAAGKVQDADAWGKRVATILSYRYGIYGDGT